MNRLSTIVIILLATNGLLFGQKADVTTLLLRTDKAINPPGRLFSIDTVVDSRRDTLNRIGTLLFSSGKITELALKGGVQRSLANFFSASLLNTEGNSPSYALVVREFIVTSTTDIMRVELALTFCKHGSSMYNTNATDSVNRSDLFLPAYKAEIIVDNSKATIVEAIKQGLAKALLKFNQYLANPNTVSALYSDFDLETVKAIQELNLLKSTYDSIQTDEDNLLHCSQFRSGVYQSFNELQQNRPSLTGELVIQQKKDFANLRKPSGSRAKHRFLGFSDGKDLFISNDLYETYALNRRYLKVKSVGRYLLWIDNYVTSTERTASAMAASYGLIGGLAAAAVSSYKDCIALDMQTGGVFMVTKDKLPQMLAGHDDLLAELAAAPNPKNEQLQFYLLDKLNQRVRHQSAR